MSKTKSINNLTNEQIDGKTIKGGFGFKRIFGIFRNRGNSQSPTGGVNPGEHPQNSAPNSAPDVTFVNEKGGITSKGIGLD